MYREETLLNVIKSVTRNGRSIVLTAVLALILVYLFSIVGYIFFKDDFILEVDRVPNATTSEGGFLSLFQPNVKGDYLKETLLLCCVSEGGGSLASVFVPAGMCQGGTDQNCTARAQREGDRDHVGGLL